MKFYSFSALIISIAFSLTLSASTPNLETEKKNQITETTGNKPNNAHESNETEGKQTQKGAEEAEKTVKIGNLAFPPSQQPGPLVSFGQNMINRKQVQAQLLVSEFKGQKQYFININPAILYAFTDSFTLFLVAPFAARYRQGNHHSAGLGDSIIQLEYAFYTKAYRAFYDQATIVANVTIPTGSTKKNPLTGIGSNSFFIGGTYCRMEINWFYFVSPGGIITTSSHRTKHGINLALEEEFTIQRNGYLIG